MQRRKFMIITASTLAMPYIGRANAGEPETVYYNATEKMPDTDLSASALKLALSKVKASYQLQPSPVGFPTQSGMLNAFKTGGEIDICWVGVDRPTWDATLAVPFPIDGGLLGYRLFLINKALQPDFSSVRSITDLKRHIAIQGPGWGDIDILRNAGITVRTGLYRNLFRMTVGGRADFFPRAAFEAINEQKEHVATAPGLAVETSLILKYRFAMMFFVSKKRPKLRDDVLTGLQAAHADGSYEEMFRSNPNVATALSQGNLDKRTLIEVANPLLPDGVKKIDPKYWFSV